MSLDETDREVTVLRGGDHYVVDAVERTVPLAGPVLAGGLGEVVVQLVLWVLWGLLAVLPCRRFKLGIVWMRGGREESAPGRVIFKQRLPRGADLDGAVAALAAEVEAGDFDDVRPRPWRITTCASSSGRRLTPAGRSGTTP